MVGRGGILEIVTLVQYTQNARSKGLAFFCLHNRTYVLVNSTLRLKRYL